MLSAVDCGARTGLYAPEEPLDATPDHRDARPDHMPDVVEEDAVFIDATGNCPPQATLIYITGSGGALYSFWPPSFAFTFIGNLTCTSSPTHMTVDRHGVAWVVSGGNLYRASTTDASCTAVTTWKPNPAPSFGDFSLSFVGTGNVDNSLYMLGNPATLGLFDTMLGTFTVVGNPPITNSIGDMTSNGDGTLYFLHDINPPTLYELDPKTAMILESWPVAATGGGSQALAFFGGLFYVFEDNAVSSLDTATAKTASLGVAPIGVTGAGQSTCVPPMPTDAGAPDVAGD